jgi:hypothetical protein
MVDGVRSESILRVVNSLSLKLILDVGLHIDEFFLQFVGEGQGIDLELELIE